MARQPALKQVPYEKCLTQRASTRKVGNKKVRLPAGRLKRGFKFGKNGKCYQVRKYRKCRTKRKVAMYKGVAIVAPCGMSVTDALKKRADLTYSQKSWDACARKNKGVSSAKKAPCRIIFFKKTGEPIMRGKGGKGSMSRKAKAMWRSRSAAFKKKFVKGDFRK
jgi:hypothetical protein